MTALGSKVVRLLACLPLAALVAAPLCAQPVANDNGTVSDASARLLWTRNGNGVDIAHPEAATFCEELELAGHEDWRLPTLEEAKSLFRPDSEPKNSYDYKGKKYPLRIDDAFVLTAPSIWTSSASYRGQPTAFLFSSGKDFSWRGDHSSFQRVLCVHDLQKDG